MKKQYIMPATDVLLIETTALLTDSMPINGTEDDDVIENANAILSRQQHSLWNDED